jgi:hypothetical protein
MEAPQINRNQYILVDSQPPECLNAALEDVADGVHHTPHLLFKYDLNLKNMQDSQYCRMHHKHQSNLAHILVPMHTTIFRLLKHVGIHTRKIPILPTN